MVRRTRTRKVINAIGFCIFVPFGLVWISGEALYELAKDESKVQKKLYQEKKKYRTRKSLAPPEPSKLKVSLPSIFGKQEQPVEFDSVDPQFQSRLLSLPGEIRDLIYQYALGGHTFHFIKPKNRLRHSRCNLPFLPCSDSKLWPSGPCGEADHSRSCIPNVYNRASAYEDPDRVERLGMFAHCTGGMIRACRSIYLEASDYLYSTNMFCLNTLDMLIHLRNSISPRHFGLIKHLQITHQVTHFEQFVSERKNSRKIPLYPPYDNKTWKEVWRIISEEMHGLKDLRVRAFGENISIRTTRVWRLCMLEEMRKVRGLDHFSFDSDNLFMKRGNLDYAEWEEDVITAKEQLTAEVMMPKNTMKIEYKEKIIEIER
ncbi:hypothetical protein TWF788_002673 [Orbilia oligospora]|uniref:DUF7730 domain-containing protein n=1 Tax=Orbilia oligospora TaxID=2813651 RepID=A0A7C8TYY7_ORBOL|nr:hypothetical protein TWF788_002673 [Orbilia oligospora]KAF3201114.1 hypothetical protein TWF679_000465 [Orbilia oligospora]